MKARRRCITSSKHQMGKFFKCWNIALTIACTLAKEQSTTPQRIRNSASPLSTAVSTESTVHLCFPLVRSLSRATCQRDSTGFYGSSADSMNTTTSEEFRTFSCHGTIHRVSCWMTLINSNLFYTELAWQQETRFTASCLLSCSTLNIILISYLHSTFTSQQRWQRLQGVHILCRSYRSTSGQCKYHCS